jgi:hypothetical protein
MTKRCANAQPAGIRVRTPIHIVESTVAFGLLNKPDRIFARMEFARRFAARSTFKEKKWLPLLQHQK